MKVYNNEEVLTKVIDTFVLKLTPPSVKDYACFYSHQINKDGCAIGCLFGDEYEEELQKWDKDEDFNGTAIQTILETKTVAQKALGQCDEDLLYALQSWHDSIPSGVDATIHDRAKTLKEVLHYVNPTYNELVDTLLKQIK